MSPVVLKSHIIRCACLAYWLAIDANILPLFFFFYHGDCEYCFPVRSQQFPQLYSLNLFFHCLGVLGSVPISYYSRILWEMKQ